MEPDVKSLLEQPLQIFRQTKSSKAEYATKFLSYFNYWFNVPQSKLEEIGKILSDFFDHCVILDDIFDGSLMRSGSPSVYLICGIDKTSNSMAYVLNNTIKNVMDLHPDLIDDCIELFIKSMYGNNMEIYWRNNYICPTEEEYLNIGLMKTCCPIQFAIRHLQKFSTNDKNVEKLATLVGQIVQIWNDYVSLASDKTAAVKTYCEDITEGKFSYPIIHAIRTQPNDDQLLKILKQRTRNYEIKKYFVSLLKKYNSFDYTLDVIDRLKNEAMEEVEKLGGNPYTEYVLELLLNEIETIG